MRDLDEFINMQFGSLSLAVQLKISFASFVLRTVRWNRMRARMCIRMGIRKEQFYCDPPWHQTQLTYDPGMDMPNL